MKDKILAQLVAKFPGVSKKFLGLMADKILPKVTEESQIEGAITELDNLPLSITDLATEFQREGDRRVTDAEKEWKKKNPQQQQQQQQPGKTNDDDKDDDDTPAWAKSLMNEVKSLKAEKVKSTLQTKVAEKLKDVPATFYAKRALPESEDDLDTYIQEIETDYATFKQDLITTGLMSAEKPLAGTGGGTASAKEVQDDIKEWANKDKKTD